jgi:parvulin-like peptidyl-prolyl isomerase
METMKNKSLRDLKPLNRLRISIPGTLLLTLGLLALGWCPSARCVPASSDTLVLVNGDPITSGYLDEMIMGAHQNFDIETEGSGVVARLLTKRTNDLLIIQDALAAGMDEEPELVALVDDRRQSYAIRAYVKENLVLPASPPADSVMTYFERYYWQIQVRRISVRTFQEAADLRLAVMGGADMDSLAQELSLDTKKLTGGLYNLLYWADLENRIRDRVVELEVGEYSDIFPYNDAFTFVRVEKKEPVDRASFSRFEKKITSEVLAATNQRLWDEFVDDLMATMEIEESMAGLAAVIADSAMVLTGKFLKNDPTPVIQVSSGEAVTGTELRQAVSHEVMQNATAPFSENLNKGRRTTTSELVLATAARAGGYFDDPQVETQVAKDLEQGLIETYLTDTVASRIKFKRSEFDEFYQENQEEFRGPEEVSLDILILDDQAEAEEAAARLADGADFGFIFAEYNPGQEATLGKSRFIKKDQLSKPFRDQLVHMEVGDSSQAVEIPMGWMIFKLVGVKPGAVPPMADVEMEIRKVIFQRKFNSYLDEHLELLRDHSEILKFDERIEAYLLSGVEGS